MKKTTSLLLGLILCASTAQARIDGEIRMVFCVLEGTKVTLQDGSEKAIEEITDTDWIRTVSGGGVHAISRVIGPEKKSVYKIKTESGREVVASSEHPFLTSSLVIVTSQELKVGDELKTLDGAEKITSIDQAPTSSKVYTLILASSETMAQREEAKVMDGSTKAGFSVAKFLRRTNPFLGLSFLEHTFYVNGIANGDGVVQGAIRN